MRVLVLLLLLLPGLAFAQDAAARRDSAIVKLNTGQQVRISGEAMSRLVGKAGVAVNDTLDFAQDDAVHRIPIPAIDTLWVRGGSAMHGAVIGGAIVGSFAAIFAAAWIGSCETSDCGSVPIAVLGGFLAGGTVGATLGGFIGSSVQSWKQTYP
jgi:hypothetical protein